MGRSGMRQLIVFMLMLGFLGSLDGEVRIKDIATVGNSNQISLIGYGLVVGLNGTGDRPSGRRGAIFTVQTISNMLERFGITVSKEELRTRNVAAVMVTARVDPFLSKGMQFDVTVSSLGDATSLEGGVLLMTPLRDPTGRNYGLAQGPVSIGGYNIETTAGERLRKNHALVGRVPSGGVLTAGLPGNGIDPSKPLQLYLLEPDFVTARRIAEAINTFFGTGQSEASNAVAQPMSPSLVQLNIPDSLSSQEKIVRFVAAIETLTVQPDIEARVVINERTGTIVAGGNVRIGEVMISHGNLTIHTRSRPIISQPNAFSNTGQTVVAQVTETQVQESPTQTAVISETTTVSELATALNALGLKPRDIIAIFQAIKQAGALRAKLIID